MKSPKIREIVCFVTLSGLHVCLDLLDSETITLMSW